MRSSVHGGAGPRRPRDAVGRSSPDAVVNRVAHSGRRWNCVILPALARDAATGPATISVRSTRLRRCPTSATAAAARLFAGPAALVTVRGRAAVPA
jgi:hypothetical protein